MKEYAEKMAKDRKGQFIITFTGKHYLNYCVPINPDKNDYYRNGLKGYIAKVVGMSGIKLNTSLKSQYDAHIEKDCIWFDNEQIASKALEYMNSLLLVKRLKE
jgi:hypothetical protein